MKLRDRQGIIFSLILGADIHRALRGTPIFIGLNPLKYYAPPTLCDNYEIRETK
jgi:hypothetical protein